MPLRGTRNDEVKAVAIGYNAHRRRGKCLARSAARMTLIKHDRVCFRYSLRAFFVLLTGACIWLGVFVNRVNVQRRAVEWVKEQGGVVTYDYEYAESGQQLASPEMPGPHWLRGRIGIDYFAGVHLVNLAGTSVSDLSELSSLGGLGALKVHETQVRDLTPLRTLKRIRYLHLRKTQVQNITPLRSLQKLELLDLSDTEVRDPSPLVHLTNLRTLYLSRTQVSQEDYRALKNSLPHCRITWSERNEE